MACIFCDIVKKKKPGHFVYEDNTHIAVLDIFPSVAGHVMVIPKRHGETILDYTEKELGQIMEVIKKVTKGLTKTYNTDMFTIGINHAEKLGVTHLHIHILPRFDNDSGGIIQTIVKKPVDKDLKTIAENIKKNIN